MGVAYSIITVEAPDRDSLRLALAEQFAVPPGEVELADAGETDGRNWAARVSCEFERLHGDVSHVLAVHAAADRPSAPAEPVLAAGLAVRLRQVLLVHNSGVRPSAYWAALPDGSMVRARVYESDDEDAAYRVDAAEAAIPGLPHVPVERISEVIRDVPLPTPVVEAALREAGPDGARPAGGDPHFVNRLRAWEMLTVRMARSWPPSAWYPAEFYREDLELRDSLEGAGGLAAALDRIDEDFRQLTADDGGAALGAEIGVPGAQLALRPWWWRRRPLEIPWQ
ncbi:hypothetical protein ABT095_28585 [Kitasatospora sp. NPDC002227]|uniref:hypothetical protein n=1 Tax=Kitasatospora sp. NPDC002227 TaxID=3154773 RepID=UPI0033341232